MAMYRKEQEVVEATQWFKNGDHPEDDCRPVPYPGGEFLSEGKVVRYFRHPDVPGEKVCECGRTMHNHGWIDQGEEGYTVCPGDYVIACFNGVYHPCRPGVFEESYELVEATP